VNVFLLLQTQQSSWFALSRVNGNLVLVHQIEL